MSLHLKCDPTHFGRIIGPHGSTIQRLQAESGVKINLVKERGVVEIVGKSEAARNAAKKAIEAIVKDEISTAMKVPDYTGKKGAHLRQLASDWAAKRESLLESAHKMWESGKKADAKRLSEAGKEAGRKVAEFNQKASDEIFRFRNEGKGDLCIDLHGQYVEEALSLLESRLSRLLRDGHVDRLQCITGAGHHSKDHIAKIKNAVHDMIEKMGLRYEVTNPGEYLIFA